MISIQLIISIIGLVTAVVSLAAAYLSFRTALKNQHVIEQQRGQRWVLPWRK